MILNPLLNIQTMWLIFIKTLKIIMQIKNKKHWSFLDDMTADVLSNEKRNPIVTELFIWAEN